MLVDLSAPLTSSIYAEDLLTLYTTSPTLVGDYSTYTERPMPNSSHFQESSIAGNQHYELIISKNIQTFFIRTSK